MNHWGLVALAAFAVYLTALPNGLVYDDLQVIPGNRLVEHPGDVWAIFTGPYRIGQQAVIGLAYRPLTVWSFGWNFGINELAGLPGDSPFGFHLLNVILHAATCIVLYAMCLRLGLGGWTGLGASLLFAVHPVHTEAVTAVVNRSEILAALFGLLFLLLHRDRRPAWACALAALAAMWGKESGITFLAMAPVMDWLFPRDEPRSRGAVYVTYGAVAAFWLGCWWWVLKDHPEQQVTPFMDNPLVALSAVQRVLTTTRIHLHYLMLLIVPVGLSSDYSFNVFPVITTIANGYVLGALALGSAAVAAGWAVRRTHPVVTFALIGYPVFFAVTSNVLVTIGVTAERHLYAPSIAWCLLVAYGAWRLYMSFGRLVAVAFAALLVAFGELTLARNRTWHDELVLFRAQAASAPASVRARFNYGTLLVKMGENERAVPELEAAAAIYPGHPDIFYNLGNALRVTHADPERVIRAYREAIRLDPGNKPAISNLAVFLTGLGRRREARPLVLELARQDPAYHSLRLLHRLLGMAP
ncbi:MAG: tetratricopeptide repeat protein [Candidatus Coatesbacteria bacterium]